MCSACSGDPEDPVEALPAFGSDDASPFWAWWKEFEEDAEETPAAAVNRQT